MDNNLFPWLASGIFTVVISLIGILVYMLIKNVNSNNTYEEQLRELLDDEYNDTAEEKISIIKRWNNYWGNIFKQAGFARYNDDNSKAGRDIIFAGIIIAILVSVIVKNVIAGILVPIGLIYGFSMIIRTRANKKQESINSLLPGFIFALKANLQASETIERAMLKVIDTMPSPLYEDLLIVKNKLQANASFQEALLELSEKTSSRDLKFLCACMIQASRSGANMENQLTSIQRVLEARRKVSDEINTAVKATSPAIWLASLIIPALFFASYFMDSNARTYWFIDPISWIAILVTIALYLIGLFLVKKQVDKIKNM